MKFNCLLVLFVIVWQFVKCEDEEENISGPPVPPLVLKNSFCGLKHDEGSCKATIPRFYFNLFTRKCDYFEFGGCGGNENNFESMEECQEKCIIKEPHPPKKGRKNNPQGMPEFCLQEEDPGICRGYITRYFYNANSKKCEKFKYGGCLGNRNNFISMDECRTTCENLAFLAADVSHPVQPHINRERENVNFSSNTPTAISKLPNISYQSQSKGSDIPTAMSKLDYKGPSMCLSSVIRGHCNAKERRFYFDHQSGKCHPFSYSGCGGNENNFMSRRSCMKTCKKGIKRGHSVSSQLSKRRKN